jgi:hypothetical protein
MTVLRPLPGIRFEAQPAPPSDALPRMDVALFAGFAASGPLDTPVAVEDAAQFANVFGGDVVLPRPAAASEARYAHLAPAVRAFFRNGGRRCWIVRVAGKKAVKNRFAVPNLTRLNADGSIEPAFVEARSEGSWSDALRGQTNIVNRPLVRVAVDPTVPFVDVRVTSAREVMAGDLVRVSWPDSDLALYLFVTAIGDAQASPPTGIARVMRLTGKPRWIRTVLASPPGDKPPTYETAGAPGAPPPGTPAVERLLFDLTVASENGRPLRLTNLGFTPDHPRSFGALPDDLALFAATQSRIEFDPNFLGETQAPEDGWPELWSDAATPRFPLAVPSIDGALYLPLGMTVLLSDPALAETAPGVELERDGLAEIGPGLFLDEHMRTATMRDILNQADALRYQAGERLTGIHAALDIEEVSMIAAPDAVHRGWFLDAEPPIASPISSPPSSPPAVPPTQSVGDCCPHETAPLGAFVDCATIDGVPAPHLTAGAPKGGSYTLSWDTAADSEELQEARQFDFSDAATIAAGSTGTLTVFGRAAGDYFYRVRRHRGTLTSDWSNGVAVRIEGVSGYVAYDEIGEQPELLEIHKAMVRMCAARGDMVALLSLPRYYDHNLAIAHASTLASTLEPVAQSYGALWHPHLIGRDDESGPLRAIPPDGATAGVMAARANTRGAWIAPANETLRGVVALTPDIGRDALQPLQDAAVNLIRHDPAGFLCLDADTLSTDDDVRALNVRRLLILVRRAALRTGNDYAFEPHSISVRNALKRGFESMLSAMFERGAFAGQTAKSAYQVVTDETVNTPNSVDEGRLIAELRVAPSRPLSFLTVRLLQLGDASVVQEVR